MFCVRTQIKGLAQMAQIKEKVEENLYKNITYKLIGIAMDIHKELGCGWPERIYYKAFGLMLEENKINYETEKEIKIYLRERLVGKERLDFVIEDKVIVEIKAKSETKSVHKSQLLSYLKGSGYNVELLFNFGTEKLKYYRMVYKKSA